MPRRVYLGYARRVQHQKTQGIPGGPVVRLRDSTSRGTGLIPNQDDPTSHAAQKKKTQEKKGEPISVNKHINGVKDRKLYGYLSAEKGIRKGSNFIYKTEVLHDIL